MWELCDKEVVLRITRSQGSRLHIGDCAATRVGLEVTIGVTVHENMSNLRQIRVGGNQLTHELRAIFGTICY